MKNSNKFSRSTTRSGKDALKSVLMMTLAVLLVFRMTHHSTSPATTSAEDLSISPTYAAADRPAPAPTQAAVNQMDAMSPADRQFVIDSVAAQMQGIAHPFSGDEAYRREAREQRYADAADRCYSRTDTVMARNICLGLLTRAKELNGDD